MSLSIASVTLTPSIVEPLGKVIIAVEVVDVFDDAFLFGGSSVIGEIVLDSTRLDGVIDEYHGFGNIEQTIGGKLQGDAPPILDTMILDKARLK